MTVTRAIWFYQLDKFHTFGTLSTFARNNFFVFNVYFRKHRIDPTNPDQMSRMRYMSAFMLAFLEALNAPTVFTAREAFIRLWKRSPHDLLMFRRGELELLNRKKKKVLNSVKNGELTPEDMEEARKVPGRHAALKAVAYFAEIAIRAGEQASAGNLTGIPSRQPRDSEDEVMMILPANVPWPEENSTLKALMHTANDGDDAMVIDWPQVDLRKHQSERFTIITPQEFADLWEEPDILELADALTRAVDLATTVSIPYIHLLHCANSTRRYSRSG